MCRYHHEAPRHAAHNGAAGLPREARCGLLFRLRGRPPACHRLGRSPSNQPTSDHADGATLGRWDARASQRPRRPELTEAIVQDRGDDRESAGPNLPALSRKRTAGFNISDGQAGSPPPQCPPKLVWNCDRSRNRTRGQPAPSGCRAWLCAGGTPRRRVAPRTRSMPGSLGRRDAVCCSGYEVGRRRAIGVVAALPINPRVTTPMVRRWAAGTPERHSGPEGR